MLAETTVASEPTCMTSSSGPSRMRCSSPAPYPFDSGFTSYPWSPAETSNYVSPPPKPLRRRWFRQRCRPRSHSGHLTLCPSSAREVPSPVGSGTRTQFRPHYVLASFRTALCSRGCDRLQAGPHVTTSDVDLGMTWGSGKATKSATLLSVSWGMASGILTEMIRSLWAGRLGA